MDTEETPPSESTDQEFSEDVLKQESEQVEAESVDMKARNLNKVTPEMVVKLSESLKNDWKKLAIKFGYTNDEVCKYQVFLIVTLIQFLIIKF